jgi:DNA-binding MarR family transcriptional regulator
MNERRAGFLISKIHRLSGRILGRMLREEHVEINPAQGRILFALWTDDGVSLGDLAHRTALGKSALTTMVDRLEAAGYVRRESSTEDRRSTLVFRTEKDRALQETYDRVSRRMTDIFYDGFDSGEIEQFEKALERILANVEQSAF